MSRDTWSSMKVRNKNTISQISKQSWVPSDKKKGRDKRDEKS